MPTQQERLFEMLMERVRNDKYPSLELLDRIEQQLYTTDQVSEYVDFLLDKIDDSWYPSGQLLNRVQRMMGLIAAASRNSAVA